MVGMRSRLNITNSYLSLMSNHSGVTGSLGVRLLTGLSYCLVTVLGQVA